MEKLCKNLQRILDMEIESGNSVERICERAFDKIDLWVGLKKGFSRKYEDGGLPEGIQMFYTIDAHYPVGKSYHCPECKHELHGPMSQQDALRAMKDQSR